MLFDAKEEIKIVSSCPVARGSVGCMEFPPALISKIAGAVQDSIEWMVLLVGERSEDGFHVKVTDFRVPQQNRTSGNVNMTEPMEGDGSTVGDDVVGVLHSHHRMGAFFSRTDETELNPFFKSSIVVAQSDKAALGFKYQAEGKVTLPCGSIGRIKFRLAVTDSPYWPVSIEREYEKNNNGLGDCDQVTVTQSETDIEIVKAKVTPESCGLKIVVKEEKPSVFGRAGGEELIAEVRLMTTGYGYVQHTRGLTSTEDASRPSHDWYKRNRDRYTSEYDATNTAGLSRRERKRLKREGKLSARSGGTFGTDYRYEVGDDDYAPLDTQAPHKRAVSFKANTGELCGLCEDIATMNTWLYLYIGERTGWREWLCADCYDFCSEGIIHRPDADEVEDTTVPVINSAVCQQTKLLVINCRCSQHREFPIHAFERSANHPYCIARLSDNRVCGQVITMNCHQMPIKHRGEEKAKEVRQRLGIGGLLPPAEIIH